MEIPLNCCSWWRHHSKAQHEANAHFTLQLRPPVCQPFIVVGLRGDYVTA
jgi:hypothetical protein